MLVTLASSKGSPGATSAALVLAAAWPRPVILVEADPSGGDLALRCRRLGGGELAPSPNILSRAARSHSGRGDRGAEHEGAGVPDAVASSAQPLASGVHAVLGLAAPGQAGGLTGLWPGIAQACAGAEGDVIADLGRLGVGSATLPLAEHAAALLLVASARLDSVVHLRETARELATAPTMGLGRRVPMWPVLITGDRHAVPDCADVDEVLACARVSAHPSRHLSFDPPALRRLEAGEAASGRLGRTLLLRSARALAEQLIAENNAGAAEHSWADDRASEVVR
jgi:hypothetical protein